MVVWCRYSESYPVEDDGPFFPHSPCHGPLDSHESNHFCLQILAWALHRVNRNAIISWPDGKIDTLPICRWSTGLDIKMISIRVTGRFYGSFWSLTWWKMGLGWGCCCDEGVGYSLLSHLTAQLQGRNSTSSALTSAAPTTEDRSKLYLQPWQKYRLFSIHLW